MKLVPIAVLVAVLVALLLGGLCSGFFTPTEAGGRGVFGALAIAIQRRRLYRHKLWEVMKQTATISVSILILLIAAG